MARNREKRGVLRTDGKIFPCPAENNNCIRCFRKLLIIQIAQFANWFFKVPHECSQQTKPPDNH